MEYIPIMLAGGFENGNCVMFTRFFYRHSEVKFPKSAKAKNLSSVFKILGCAQDDTAVILAKELKDDKSFNKNKFLL